MSNSCAGTEVAAATGDSNITNVALYLNTGYTGAYGRNINSACANDAIGYPSPSSTESRVCTPSPLPKGRGR